MTNHPAVFSATILETVKPLLQDARLIIDPFCGTGKVASLQEFCPQATITGTELQYKWAALTPGMVNGNAMYLPFPANTFDICFTSPCYGNRMADSFTPGDGSQQAWEHAAKTRATYTHRHGSKLHPDNAGQMQWGTSYRTLHEVVWKEVYRVLTDNGTFILNISDHIRNKKRVRVTDWHIDTITKIGFSIVDKIDVNTPRNRRGQNWEARVDHESIVVFIKEVK